MRNWQKDRRDALTLFGLATCSDTGILEYKRESAICQAESRFGQGAISSDILEDELQKISDAYGTLFFEFQEPVIRALEKLLQLPRLDRTDNPPEIEEGETLDFAHALSIDSCRLTDAELGQAYLTKLQDFRAADEESIGPQHLEIPAGKTDRREIAYYAFHTLKRLAPDERWLLNEANKARCQYSSIELQLQVKGHLDTDLRLISTSEVVLLQRSRFLSKKSYVTLLVDVPRDKALLRLCVLYRVVDAVDAGFMEHTFNALTTYEQSWLITGLLHQSPAVSVDSVSEDHARTLPLDILPRYRDWNTRRDVLLASLQRLAESFKTGLSVPHVVKEIRPVSVPGDQSFSERYKSSSYDFPSQDGGLYSSARARLSPPLSAASKASRANRSLRDGGVPIFEDDDQFPVFSKRPGSGSGASSYEISRGSPGLPPMPGGLSTEDYISWKLPEEEEEDEYPFPFLILKSRTHAVGDEEANKESGAKPEADVTHGESTSLPVQQQDPNQRKCYMCQEMIIVSRRKEWQLHVLDDLEPYQCMELHCPSAETTYKRRSALRDHYTRVHPSAEIMSTTSPSYICPFCEDVIDGKPSQRWRHIGRHMEEVAFAIVPRQYEDWDFYTDAATSARSMSTRNRKGQNKHPEDPSAAPLASVYRIFWTCKSLESYKAAILSLKTNTCSFCGYEFPSINYGPHQRLNHLNVVHEVDKCADDIRLFSLHDFQRHLVGYHRAKIGEYTTTLELACQGYTVDVQEDNEGDEDEYEAYDPLQQPGVIDQD